jgi:hypothetical protein
MVEWRGSDFDPETVDEVGIQKQLTNSPRSALTKQTESIASP